MIDDFITKFTKRLESGLPGAIAHKRMAPAQRNIQNFIEQDYPDAHKASVLMLMYLHNEEIYFVMIQRPEYDGIHGGQVSFPGGRIEKSDATPWDAALREAHEEIGVNPKNIKHVASLSPIYIPPSNFFVYVCLGYISGRPEFIPDEKEVQNIIEAPIALLLDEKIKSEMEFSRNDMKMIVPCYKILNRNVWGATAIILSEVEEILRSL